jgi:hypothetical protein
MSSQMNTYVLFGVSFAGRELPDEDKAAAYLDSPFDPATNPVNNVTLIVDGMNGSYGFLGHVIAKSRDGSGLEEPVSLPMDYYGEYADRVGDVSAALVDLGFNPASFPLPGIHVVSHYR